MTNNEKLFRLLGWETSPNGKKFKSPYARAYFTWRHSKYHERLASKPYDFESSLDTVASAEAQLTDDELITYGTELSLHFSVEPSWNLGFAKCVTADPMTRTVALISTLKHHRK